MNLAGKTALITGGARGMGRVSAIELAKMGAQVIIVDWEGEEGTRTRDHINRLTGRKAADFVYCDLSSLDEVRRTGGRREGPVPGTAHPDVQCRHHRPRAPAQRRTAGKCTWPPATWPTSC